MDTKRCAKCKLDLALDRFNKSKNQSQGRASYCKSCRAAYRKEYKAPGEPRLVWAKKAIYRARERIQQHVDLTPEHVVKLLSDSNDRCVYCDSELSLKATLGERYQKSPSLDRLDPSLGYTTGNVAVCCFRCNQIKSDATPDELRRIANKVEQLLRRSSP